MKSMHGHWLVLCAVLAAAGICAQAADYTFYEPGKAPAPKGEKRPSEMAKTRGSPDVGLPCSLSADIMFLKDNLESSRSVGYGWVANVKSGSVGYKPRITLTAINQPIQENSKLIVEYFAKTLTDSRKIQVAVEHIPAPAIPRGQSRIVNAEGVNLYQYVRRDTDGYQHKSGRVFAGLILSLFDAQNKLLIQYMTDRQLQDQASADPQEEREYTGN